MWYIVGTRQVTATRIRTTPAVQGYVGDTPNPNPMT